MHKINETEVTAEGCDWGVEFDDGDIYEAEDEADARYVAKFTGGNKVVARDVYVTAWAEVES